MSCLCNSLYWTKNVGCDYSSYIFIFIIVHWPDLAKFISSGQVSLIQKHSLQDALEDNSVLHKGSKLIVYKAPRSRPVCLLTFYVLSIYLLCPEGLWNVLQNSQESVIFSNSYSEEHLWTVAFQLIVVTQSQQWKHQSCEICSKLTTKTPQRRHWYCSGVFIVNYKLISRLVMVFLFLTLKK